MDLTECHRMAIPRDPMCVLYVARKGHGHEAIYNLILQSNRRDRDGPHFVSLQVSASPIEAAIE